MQIAKNSFSGINLRELKREQDFFEHSIQLIQENMTASI